MSKRAMKSVQAPGAVVMVRPHHFHPNPQTAADNRFQQSAEGLDAARIARVAFEEVTAAAVALTEAGVQVHLFDDEQSQLRPDSVFPNNWFSTHAGGHVAIYPMYSENRRRERRSDVIELLKSRYRVQDVIDYSGLEADGLFLEGTGAMVLDHAERVAYVVRSNRANAVALERFCTHFNFEPMVFDAVDGEGVPVYHTNVVMCIGTGFALIGGELITSRRAEVETRVRESGRELINLTAAQIAEFAGNALELLGRDGHVLALSKRAAEALTPEQRQRIEQHARLLPLSVPTIEMAGGSVRCMLAGVHLASRAQVPAVM
jgi:hypothetical protein